MPFLLTRTNLKIHINKIKSKRINVNACFMDKSESKRAHEMDISANTNKLKDTRDEPSVTDNSNVEVIQAPEYFKLF